MICRAPKAHVALDDCSVLPCYDDELKLSFSMTLDHLQPSCIGGRVRVGAAALVIVAAVMACAHAATAAVAKALKVVNATHKVIVGVYLTPLACNDDTDDALGEGVIEPGASRPIELQGNCGCRYNLRFVFADKSAIDRFDIDVCKRPSFRVTNR